MDQIQALIGYVWIEKRWGPWGLIVFLADKPHQEHVQNIDDFIWRICVPNSILNIITKPF